MDNSKQSVNQIILTTWLMIALLIMFGSTGTSLYFIIQFIISHPAHNKAFILGGLSCFHETLNIQTTVKNIIITTTENWGLIAKHRFTTSVCGNCFIHHVSIPAYFKLAGSTTIKPNYNQLLVLS
ncbi:hypothetical protein [Fulvivirga sediminis]|uniref:Uncharacterized protein n=1 Tax=Fulvivirga sediminis TaxID=2803949 RepID=A0A937F6Q3_9BACT|nr:hypothetical protein [Fulvivirga sediminis]MBL3655093.1 hypothetical protein [Fulvivirga sediminis]